MPENPTPKSSLRLIAAVILAAATPVAKAGAQVAEATMLAATDHAIAAPDPTAPGPEAAGCPAPQGGGCAVRLASTSLAAAPIAGQVIQPVIPADLSAPIAGVRPADPPAAASAPDAAAGAPRAVPSVLIGEAATLVSADGGTARDLTRARRDRLRQIDPALFRVLLDAGIFDPADNGFAARLQADLAALSCYDGRVDGTWGTQSQAALARYFARLGQAAPAEPPGPGLFRQVAAAPALRCPQLAARTPSRAAPRATEAAAAPRDRARAPNTARTRPAEAATPVRVTPRATAPQAPATQTRRAPQTTAPVRGTGQIDTNMLGSGVFR